MYYEKHKLHFACTGCGACCTGGPDHYVAVTPAEQRRIQRHLGISWRWFRRRYVSRFDDTIESLPFDQERCVFLGKDNRCRIYAVRPAQCRHYPFWPELVAKRSAWMDEAKRCEGIDRGAVVPLARIRAELRKQRG